MYFSLWLLGSCLPLAQALPGCKRAQTPSPTPPCATRSRSPGSPLLPPYSHRARSNLMYLRPLAKGGWNRPAPLKIARGEGQPGAQQHTTARRDSPAHPNPQQPKPSELREAISRLKPPVFLQACCSSGFPCSPHPFLQLTTRRCYCFPYGKLRELRAAAVPGRWHRHIAGSARDPQLWSKFLRVG